MERQWKIAQTSHQISASMRLCSLRPKIFDDILKRIEALLLRKSQLSDIPIYPTRWICKRCIVLPSHLATDQDSSEGWERRLKLENSSSIHFTCPAIPIGRSNGTSSERHTYTIRFLSARLIRRGYVPLLCRSAPQRPSWWGRKRLERGGIDDDDESSSSRTYRPQRGPRHGLI